MVVKAIKSEDRYGNTVYICPLCGHVFYSIKEFQRHLMKSHLYKKNRKARIRKKIEKRGYIRSVDFGRPKVPEVSEEHKEEKPKKPEKKPEERLVKEEKPKEEKKEIAKEETSEELLNEFRKFVEKRRKGKKTVRFKITTLARELNISVDEARKIVESVENASMKGDRVTVKFE